MVYLSEHANNILKNYLREKGHTIVEVVKTEAVYDAVSSHSDIYLCSIGNDMILSPEQAVNIGGVLEERGISYTLGKPLKGTNYPDNIAYNAACIGSYLIHNLKYTDAAILKKAEEHGLKTIQVKQGYTKCSLVIVDERSLITADKGIASRLSQYPLDVLLITEGHVRLEGFPFGFLGGASGRVGDEILFNGNLSAHPDFERIADFIESRGLKPVFFKEYPLEDIGSIFWIE